MGNNKQGKIMERVLVTEETLAKVFTEWDLRYRNSPENFMSEVQHLLKETPYSYGKSCALYLIKLLEEK